MKKKFATISLLTLGLTFALTGCGTTGETPAAGVSIENAEGQTLGFTYLYDLGNGYKLYADNLTTIVYLRYDYQGGKGATATGSSSFCPYISPNGYYYKVNTQTRVIEEYIPNHSISSSTEDEEVDVTQGSSSSNQKQDIEAILNENGQKNQNSNNQQKQETNSTQGQTSQNPNDNDGEITQQDPNKASGTTVEETPQEEDSQEEIKNE